MNRRLLTAIAFLGCLTWGASAHADGYRGVFGGILQCLRTPPVHFDGTIVDAALDPAFRDDFDTLVDLLGKANLVDALKGDGPFTVYAPTDKAFEKLPPELAGTLVNDEVILTQVLLYHVSAGIRDPRRTFRPREVKTLQGQTVFYNRNGKTPQINQSNASCQSVRTNNGKIFIIDSVLLPQFVD